MRDTGVNLGWADKCQLRGNLNGEMKAALGSVKEWQEKTSDQS